MITFMMLMMPTHRYVICMHTCIHTYRRVSAQTHMLSAEAGGPGRFDRWVRGVWLPTPSQWRDLGGGLRSAPICWKKGGGGKGGEGGGRGGGGGGEGGGGGGGGGGRGEVGGGTKEGFTRLPRAEGSE